MDRKESSVRRLVLVQDRGAEKWMSFAALSETTFTSPAASRFARSPTFSTAFFAVGVHTPAEQLMFCVAPLEITTAAWVTARSAANATVVQSANTNARSSPSK